MSAVPKLQSDRVAEILRDEAEVLDDLRRVRLEKQFLQAASDRLGNELRRGPSTPPSLGSRRWVAASSVAVALAAAAALWLAFGMRAPGSAPAYAVRSADGSHAGAVTPGTELALAAGESATVQLFDLGVSVSERSRLRVEAVSYDDVRVAFSEGEARFAFHPHERGRQHVAIHTPVARIEIVGTELTVRVSDRGTEVDVHEGVVRVIPSGGEVSLVRAGSSIVVPPVNREALLEETALEETALEETALEETALEETALEESGERALEETETAALAAPLAVGEGGDTEPSTREPEGSVEGSATEGPSDSSLLARAEGLLEHGDHHGAERLLEALVVDARQRSDRAHAWALLGESREGRADYPGALSAFDHAEDAARGAAQANALAEHARILDRRMHDSDAARSDYARYLTEYPDGPNATQIRTRLCILGGAPGIVCD